MQLQISNLYQTDNVWANDDIDYWRIFKLRYSIKGNFSDA